MAEKVRADGKLAPIYADYFVMDNPGVNPQVKINAEIAPKLARCNPQMLDIVDTILDKLIHYQDSFRHSAYESV